MNIGRMRHRVALRAYVVTGQDSYGQEKWEWSTIGTYWAEVVTLSGREAVNAQQIKAESTHRVRMRAGGCGAGVLPDQRFLFEGRTLEILHVNNVDFRNREYLILCKEVVVPTPS